MGTDTMAAGLDTAAGTARETSRGSTAAGVARSQSRALARPDLFAQPQVQVRRASRAHSVPTAREAPPPPSRAVQPARGAPRRAAPRAARPAPLAPMGSGRARVPTSTAAARGRAPALLDSIVEWAAPARSAHPAPSAHFAPAGPRYRRSAQRRVSYFCLLCARVWFPEL